MRCINRVIFFGQIADHPDVTMEDGIKVARFVLETARRFKLPDGRYSETLEEHQCVARDGPRAARLASIIEQLATPGTRVYVDGRLTYMGAQAVVEVGEFVLAAERGPKRPADPGPVAA